MFYSQGRAALKGGKAEAAHLVLERAYQLRPTPQIGFALGLSELEMGLFVQAASHMALYVHQFPEDVTSEERKAFAEAERNVAQLFFDVNVERVRITVDNEDFGNTPFVFQPRYVLAGRHTIRATCNGFKPVAQTYDVVAGKRTDVRIVLEKDIPASAPAQGPAASGDASQHPPIASDRTSRSAPPPPANPWGEPRAIVVAGGAALTLAVGALAVVEGLRAASTESEASSLSARLGSTGCSAASSESCSHLAERKDDHRAAIDLMRGAAVGALVLGGVTAAAWFLWPHGKVQVAPHVGPSTAGITISGSL